MLIALVALNIYQYKRHTTKKKYNACIDQAYENRTQTYINFGESSKNLNNINQLKQVIEIIEQKHDKAIEYCQLRFKEEI
jgi:hypothetical protein